MTVAKVGQVLDKTTTTSVDLRIFITPVDQFGSESAWALSPVVLDTRRRTFTLSPCWVPQDQLSTLKLAFGWGVCTVSVMRVKHRQIIYVVVPNYNMVP